MLNTEQIAAHAIVICTDLQNQKWKVLYGFPINREGTNDNVQTRIWDPFALLPQDQITRQDIPDWPPINEPTVRPAIFCGGHVQMEDGRILWAGGVKIPEGQTDAPHFPDPGIQGINYTYIFDPTDNLAL